MTYVAVAARRDEPAGTLRGEVRRVHPDILPPRPGRFGSPVGVCPHAHRSAGIALACAEELARAWRA